MHAHNEPVEGEQGSTRVTTHAALRFLQRHGIDANPRERVRELFESAEEATDAGARARRVGELVFVYQRHGSENVVVTVKRAFDPEPSAEVAR